MLKFTFESEIGDLRDAKVLSVDYVNPLSAFYSVSYFLQCFLSIWCYQYRHLFCVINIDTNLVSSISTPIWCRQYRHQFCVINIDTNVVSSISTPIWCRQNRHQFCVINIDTNMVSSISTPIWCH
jgi:hypothetical protein